MKPLRETKLGQWLKDKAPKVLDVVGDSIPDKGVIGFIKNLVTKDPDLSPEVKAEFELKYMEFEKDILEMALKDIADARASNVAIQESDKASWLAKNTGYLMDFTFIFAFLVMLFMIVYRQVPDENKEIFYMAFGSLITFVGTSVTFHRGTSKGSDDKQKTIDRMLKR